MSDFANRPWVTTDAPLAPPVLDAEGNPVVVAAPPATDPNKPATWDQVSAQLSAIEHGKLEKNPAKVLEAYAALGKLVP